MKKIGILTFQGAINYGAILQAYALQTTLVKLNPIYEVNVIDYKQRNIEDSYSVSEMNNKNIPLVKRVAATILFGPTRIVKRNKFKKFVDNNINLTNTVHKPELIPDFDYFIVGSDQVWNLEITDNDTTYLFDFVKNKNSSKISYAASIGKSTITTNEHNLFDKYLNDFDYISVREEDAKNLLKNQLNINATTVLDPTLLLTKEEWLSLVEHEKVKKEKYILVYSLEKNAILDQLVKDIARTRNLKIKYVDRGETGSLLNKINPIGISTPYQYLSLFRDAELIITNSFHGTAFAVNLNKEFYTVPHTTRGSRMINLLNKLDLQSRVVGKKFDFNLSENICYEDITKKLDNLRKDSIHFLQESIK